MPDPEDDDALLDEDMGDDSFLLKVAHAPASKAHPEMLLQTVVADRYQLEALAGQGGMGAVYRATDLRAGGPVAVKVLGREAGNEATERLMREARLLSELTHPSIVRHLDHGKMAKGDPYLVMEWLDGIELNVRLEAGRLSVDESASLGRQVANGLGAAHDRGILHRDIKPHNLFVVDRDLEKVKILDFGLARFNDAQAGADVHRMTRKGTSIGTPAYMSPEQVRGATEIDDRADIFSLGCTLFECLTGRPPFVAKHTTDLLGKIVFEEAPRVRTLRDDVPPDLDDLLARMLAKAPAARPGHRDVALALSPDRGRTSG